MANTICDQGWPDVRDGADRVREMDALLDRLCEVEGWLELELTDEAMERFRADFGVDDLRSAS